MKTLYLDCGMGAAGDMLTAALIELLPDPDAFIEKLNKIGIPDVQITKEKAVKCGITGTHVSVKVHGIEEDESMHEHSHGEHDHGHDHHHDEHDHEHDDHEHHHDHSHDDEHHHDEHHDDHDHHHHDGHDHHHDHFHDDDEHDHDHDHHHDHAHSHDHTHHHTSLHDIEHIVRDHMDIPDEVKNDILSVYNLIAEAESHVHDVPVTEIHFHEVGTMDAVADITAVCLLMHELGPDQVIASPVNTGSGQVRCAHGILPVPAPATAYILQDIPAYQGMIKSELCTPTGAALLKHFVTKFGNMPVMQTTAIGYGMGKKDFEAANCVRAMIGNTQDLTDTVIELSCNVDDMTAEEASFAMDRFFEGGALEVYTVPVGMKKSRPGLLIRVLCKPSDRDDIVKLIFKYTSTIGIRQTQAERFVLDRKIETKDTAYGQVRIKTSTGYGVTRSKYEYDDLARIAAEQGKSIREISQELGNE